MTPQESQMLNDLIGKVQQTQLGRKDPEAEQLLAEGLGNDPDAVYILAQTVLVQDLALRQAKAQIDQLRQQQSAQAPSRPTSFLGNLLHRDQDRPPSPVAPQQPPQYQAQPQYQPVNYGQAPFSGPPPFAQQQPVFVEQPSFLRSAATTAAGVAAGALAFEGIESLLHGGHGGYGPGWGYGGGMPMEMPMGGRPEETIINNYYDSPGDVGEHHGHDLGMGGDQPDAFREHHEHEANYDDRPGDAAGLHNASYDPTGDVSYDDRQTGDLDNPQLDDVSMSGGDDAQVDDSSLGDDSGFDSGGDLGGDSGGFDGGDDLA
jgi:hypothetical protein